jgi:hypothetical protein
VGSPSLRRTTSSHSRRSGLVVWSAGYAWSGRYGVGMASPAAVPDPRVPPADPQAIRACLTPTLAAEFDHEWNIVLDRVKQSQDLTDLHELLAKWRHTAHLELRDPGATYRILAKAEQIQRTGRNPDADPVDLHALLQQRLGR